MNSTFSVITAKQINKIFQEHEESLINIIKEAYLLHEAKDSINPKSYFLNFPDKPKSRIIALPAYLGGQFNVSGIKWIASNPENTSKGFPRASAVLILNDFETGYPFACIESSIISATRTALSAVLAVDTIKHGNKNLGKVGFVGNSLIARYIYHYLYVNNFVFESIKLFDLSHEASLNMQNSFNRDDYNNTLQCKSVEEAITDSDLVVFATTASKPYVFDPKLVKSRAILLNISLRDLAPEVLLACNNIVDDIEHVLDANTSPYCTYIKTGNKDFINGTLAQLINGNRLLNENLPTIFSPMGLGILDIALGKFAYDMIPSKLVIKDFF